MINRIIKCSVTVLLCGFALGTRTTLNRALAQENPTLLQQPLAPALPGANADPNIAVFKGTYYIYPTTDGTEGWNATSFKVWSSKDRNRWKDRGVILDLPRDLMWAKGHAWAPTIARKGKRY